MNLSAFTQADLSSTPNLPMITACSATTWSIVASHGASSHRHDAGAWVRPCHVDKPEWSGSGSRHAPCMSPHQALSAFISSQSKAGNHNGKTVSLLVMTCMNLPRIIAGGTAGSLLLQVIHLHVKMGAPEHRDSGALTGSPALTPWP